MRALSAALISLLASLSAGAQGTSYAIDTQQSKMDIHVGKEGAFKAFGHDHLIAAKQLSGEVQFDPQKLDKSSVRLHVPTKSITVIDPGESEKDRKEVEATMESDKVLDVAKFPEITFTSTSISAAKKTSDGWELTLSGKLNLHGVEKAVSFPLHVRAENNELHAQGEVSILQTDYGVTPVKVGGGTVKVKDKLKITFNIVARKN
ncbi:MAG: YceI family protein [Candidatus Acidoferrum typicum]|nr:YceI family protein [Candidatus Acidoferrum typicum]